MKKMNRSVLMKSHVLLAAFILPVAMMFFTTGALYTWEVKGGYNSVSHELVLSEPIKGELSAMVALATQELNKRSVALPSGRAKIKKIGDSFKLEWTGSKKDIILEPSSTPLMAKLTIKKTTWHRRFVQLHKAKGGTPFKIYAVVFVVFLLLLLMTGFVMAWQSPKLRKLTIGSSLLGIATFFMMVLIS